MKILMVCLGNICRSPLAEGLLRKKAIENNLDWEIDSAGTNGYHTGEPPHKLSQKVATLNGLDISCQIARQFSPDDIEKFDLIYAMANDVLEDIKRMSGNKFDNNKVKLFLSEINGSNEDVQDPWYGEEDGYHKVYTVIDNACDVIINKYSRNENPVNLKNV